MKRANTVTAVLFCCLTLVMGALLVKNGRTALGQLRDAWRQAPTLLARLDAVTEQGENTLNAALDKDHAFVQLFGGVQRLLGKRYVEDAAGSPVAKLRSGALTFATITENTDPTPNAEAVKALADVLSADGIPLMAVTAPNKLQSGAAQMPVGLADYGNEICDNYLAALRERGVPALDLREAFAARSDYDSLFFVTDHHWKPEGALFACAVLMPELSARYGFPVQEALLREEAYDVETLRGVFLGSQGKRTGSLYAGTDDFSVFTPKQDTSFTYSIPQSNTVREGSFAQALCYPERLSDADPFAANPYTYYSGGDWASSTVVNHNNPEGPKLVLIRDSFACALMPFLALQCRELVTYDVRYFEGDLAEAIRAEAPDLVLVFYAASTTRLNTMFDFS